MFSHTALLSVIEMLYSDLSQLYTEPPENALMSPSSQDIFKQLWFTIVIQFLECELLYVYHAINYTVTFNLSLSFAYQYLTYESGLLVSKQVFQLFLYMYICIYSYLFIYLFLISCWYRKEMDVLFLEKIVTCFITHVFSALYLYHLVDW